MTPKCRNSSICVETGCQIEHTRNTQSTRSVEIDTVVRVETCCIQYTSAAH